MRDRNPYIDITPYQEFIKATDKNLDPESDAFKIAVVTLYGFINRISSYKSLAWHTNTLHRICAVAVRNLKASKVWVQKGKKFRHEFKSYVTKRGKHDWKLAMSLWLDICVAMGTIVKDKGKYGLREWIGRKTFSQQIKERYRLSEFQKRQQSQIKSSGS